MPTEYEVVSTDLHYNYPDSFELTDTSVIDWYRRHREGSRLCSTNWGSFADPRRTTYRGYTELQDKKRTSSMACSGRSMTMAMTMSSQTHGSTSSTTGTHRYAFPSMGFKCSRRT